MDPHAIAFPKLDEHQLATLAELATLEVYERGEALKNHCDKLLKAAEDKIEKIRVARDGSAAGTEPLDAE